MSEQATVGGEATTWNMRLELNADGTIDVNAVLVRLALAEQALWLAGRCAAFGRDTDNEMAAGQAWHEWHGRYGSMAAEVDDSKIAQLAARRNEIEEATVTKIREMREGEGW